MARNCGQCGKSYSARACGPTHAAIAVECAEQAVIRAAERIGVAWRTRRATLNEAAALMSALDRLDAAAGRTKGARR